MYFQIWKISILHQQPSSNAYHNHWDTVRCHLTKTRVQPLAIRAKMGESKLIVSLDDNIQQGGEQHKNGKYAYWKGELCELKRRILIHTHILYFWLVLFSTYVFIVFITLCSFCIYIVLLFNSFGLNFWSKIFQLLFSTYFCTHAL